MEVHLFKKYMNFFKFPRFLFTTIVQKKSKFRFFDIAANLADDVFSGIYYEKQSHESDLDSIIERAQNEGCDRMLIVGKLIYILDLIFFRGGYIEDAIKSYEICKKSENFYCTVGVHPCRVMVKLKKTIHKEVFEIGDRKNGRSI